MAYAARSGFAGLLSLPFRRDTWRHMLFALLLPLTFALVLSLQYVMKAAQEHGHPRLGPVVLAVALAGIALAGPAFERMRLRVFFGETVAPREGGRVRHGLAFFVVNMLLSTLSFAAAAGWVIVCARNLTYPIWGWAPYPTPAWGGPTPLGAVALHFAAGVVAFFVMPWVVIHTTNWQRAAVRRHLGRER
ncbi:hypothetical protein WDV06_36075 [Streptomyces racemochromogenes]|uniref:Uncharacterized protein n=1 Tax=Streptomyces racemochromogenes TaxID=67353 RepID=A0ABW7PS51_9ACTN